MIKFFILKKNYLIAEYQFRSHIQRRDESAREWSAELRLLSTDCEFGDTSAQNKQIAKQLIFNCHSDRLREKLLSKLKEHNCELSAVLEIMTNDEDAKKNVQELKSGSSGSIAPIQK